MIAVQSSDLAAVDYHGRTLVIAFHSGGVYEYYDVPQTEYAGLMNAESHGKYFHARIRGTYPYRKVSG